MPIRVISGNPGDQWTNDTGKVAYQFIVNWSNSCGLCAQFDHAIKPTSWPIPLHIGCRCKQELIYPAASARPFVDFREIVRDLEPDEQNRVIGATNWRLVEAGIVKWEDVVTSSRIRDLTEVVSLKGLTRDDLRGVGVTPGRVRRLIEAANTPAQQLADESRRRILAALEARGVQARDVRRTVAERLASRVAARAIGTGGGGAAGGEAGGVAPPPAPGPLPGTPPAAPAILDLPPPPPAPRPSRVTVTVDDRPAHDAAWRRVLGRVPGDEELASLSGAPDGARLVGWTWQDDEPSITWEVPGVATGTRAFRDDGPGHRVVSAVSLQVEPSQRKRGIGREAFGRMVDAAAAAGFDRIATYAARGKDVVGYNVWPKFGYDGDLPPDIATALPDDLASARRVSDLMATARGRQWWKKNGDGIHLSFDLTPNSLSMRVWKAYQAAKAATSPTSRKRTKR